MRTPRLPVVDWTDATADLNGLGHFAERRNLVSARVPSHFNWPLHNMACLVSAGKRLGARGFKKRMIYAWPWHVKDVARGTFEHRRNYACPFVLNQWAVGNNGVCLIIVGNNGVCLIIRLLQCAVVTRNCSIGCLSAAWRKFRAFRIFVVGRKPAVYRVAQKLLDIDSIFNP